MQSNGISKLIVLIFGIYSVRGVNYLLQPLQLGTNCNILILSAYAFILFISFNYLANTLMLWKEDVQLKVDEQIKEKEDDNNE